MTDVLRVHEWTYVSKVRDACARLVVEDGATAHLDADTAVSQGSYRAALKAAGAVCHALDEVIEGRVRGFVIASCKSVLGNYLLYAVQRVRMCCFSMTNGRLAGLLVYRSSARFVRCVRLGTTRGQRALCPTKTSRRAHTAFACSTMLPSARPTP